MYACMYVIYTFYHVVAAAVAKYCDENVCVCVCVCVSVCPFIRLCITQMIVIVLVSLNVCQLITVRN